MEDELKIESPLSKVEIGVTFIWFSPCHTGPHNSEVTFEPSIFQLLAQLITPSLLNVEQQ